MTHEPEPIVFPLGASGPFHRLQAALRLLDHERPAIGRRVLACIAITWVPLVLLSWWQGLAPPADAATASVMTHIATYARFLVTLPLLIVAENSVRPQLEQALSHAVTSGLVPKATYGRFVDIMMRALQARESTAAEVVVLALAFATSQISVTVATHGHHASWIHVGPELTWAGRWYAWVSLPLLQFMIYRWFYRLSLWWRVMFGLSRLDLNILPGHPDERGGLAFLGDSVQAFALLALAFAGAAAGSVADFVLNEGAPLGELKGFIAGAALAILGLFLGPLFAFFRPAYRAKDEALIRYEALAQQHWQTFTDRWLEAAPREPASEHGREPEFSPLADLATLVKGAREMKTLPITKEGVLPLVVAIILPFLPLLATVFPLDELLAGMVHVFLGKAE
ncbi:hypothetical protein ACW73L_05845 [Methylolobus aquaticus]